MKGLRQQTTPRRLYIAFYPKGRDVTPDITHTALLLTSHSTTKTDDAAPAADAIRYHVTIGGGCGWTYNCDAVPARTTKLCSVLLVDDIPAGVTHADIARVMKNVPIRQCDVNWFCYHWVTSALQVSIHYLFLCRSEPDVRCRLSHRLASSDVPSLAHTWTYGIVACSFVRRTTHLTPFLQSLYQLAIPSESPLPLTSR